MPNNLGDLRAKPGRSFVGDLRSLLEGDLNQNKVQKTAWALRGWALPRVWCCRRLWGPPVACPSPWVGQDPLPWGPILD